MNKVKSFFAEIPSEPSRMDMILMRLDNDVNTHTLSLNTAGENPRIRQVTDAIGALPGGRCGIVRCVVYE